MADNHPFLSYLTEMDEAQTGLGLIFLLAVSALCGGIVIWLIISEGIRHNTAQGQNTTDSGPSH